jgi:SnoaL-like domain
MPSRTCAANVTRMLTDFVDLTWDGARLTHDGSFTQNDACRGLRVSTRLEECLLAQARPKSAAESAIAPPLPMLVRLHTHNPEPLRHHTLTLNPADAAERASCMPSTSMPRALGRLIDAINSHDARRVAQAFTTDYRCEMPMHPDRSFTGSDHVQDNYQALFAKVPELVATVTDWSTDGDISWSEWEMNGVDVHGAAVLMRGVVIATSAGDGPIQHTRFYLDPVN